MPLDATSAEARALLDIGTPSLRALATVLRDRALWPAGFEWDYGSCEGCAMGISAALWEKVDWHKLDAVAVRGIFPRLKLLAKDDVFNLSPAGAARIFYNAGLFESEWIPRSQVVPERVADLIDQYLATTTAPQGAG